jgi:hypothetical protein
MSSKHILFLFTLLVFAGCSTYKELKPDPPLSSEERGYNPVLDGKEGFELKQSKKYFMKFPRPTGEFFYLVLTTPIKPSISAFFTGMFDDGKGTILKGKDVSAKDDSISIFPIDTLTEFSYWVIDSVAKDCSLPLTYRYVPQWRYTFETKFAEYQRILAENLAPRDVYDAINPEYSFEQFDFARALAGLRTKNARLREMNKELLQLEAVFPKNIAASKDTASVAYAAFRVKVDDEIRFHSNYDDVISVFQKEAETHGNLSAFLSSTEYFVKFLSNGSKYRPQIVQKAKAIFLTRLDGALSFYQKQLRAKEDLTPIELLPSPVNVETLYRACDAAVPDAFGVMQRFIQRCNAEIVALQKTEAQISEISSSTDQGSLWPPDNYYPDALAKLRQIRIPEVHSTQDEVYKQYAVVILLGSRTAELQKKLDDLQTMYQQAGAIVQQINTLKAQNNLKGVIGLLRQQQRSTFLLKHYSDVDILSLNSQRDDLATSISAKMWGKAESRLRDLAADKDYVQYSAVASKKDQIVKESEAAIFNGVKSASESRVDQFVAANYSKIENVAKLYQDSVFLPVYQLTFSSGGAAELQQKRQQIDDYLSKKKYGEFPQTAIKAIYPQLKKNPKDRGVEIARAIVEHGKFYKGNDKQILNFIDECDPTVPKSIARAKEYREFYALPTTNSQSGTNQYVFRIKLNIQSDAEFPVFDVNIKLPAEVAENAKTKAWYDEISINKKVIKNEGRVRITAPSSNNGYEAQISPVQMDKAGRNILEIKFSYPGLRVFEISAMAQVPIIRKN